MRLFVTTLGFALLLGGCLSKLEESTDDTKAYVKRSVEKMEEVEKLQSKGGSLELLDSPKEMTRYQAIKKLILEATTDDEVHGFIAALAPLKDNASYPLGDVTIPNVTIIGDYRFPDRPELFKMTKSLHTDYMGAVLKISEGLQRNLSKEGGLKPGSKLENDHFTYLARMALVGPAIFGAYEFDGEHDRVGLAPLAPIPLTEDDKKDEEKVKEFDKLQQEYQRESKRLKKLRIRFAKVLLGLMQQAGDKLDAQLRIDATTYLSAKMGLVRGVDFN